MKYAVDYFKICSYIYWQKDETENISRYINSFSPSKTQYVTDDSQYDASYRLKSKNIS